MSDGSRTFETIQVEHDGASARLVMQPSRGHERSQRQDAGRTGDGAVSISGATRRSASSSSPALARRRSSLAPTSTSWRADADERHASTRSWPARLRSHREHRQAGDRRDQWLRARRRLRAGDGVHASDRGRHGEARSAGDQSRPDSRLRRHAAAGAAGRHGPALELMLTGQPVSAAEAHAARTGQSRRRRRPSCDEEVETLASSCREQAARLRCATSSRRSTRACRCRSPRACASRRRFSGCCEHRRHARRHARVSREAQARVQGEIACGATTADTAGPAVGRFRPSFRDRVLPIQRRDHRSLRDGARRALDRGRRASG